MSNSDVKWIKIVVDIFDDEKMLLIEQLPDADTLVVIWFKLLCFSGRSCSKGVLLINNQIPCTDEMLSAVFRRPLNTVRLALETFEKLGMIQIFDGVIAISNWAKHQNLDKIEEKRVYQRKYMQSKREEQRRLATCEANSKSNCKANSKSNCKANCKANCEGVCEVDVSRLEREEEIEEERDEEYEGILSGAETAPDPPKAIFELPLNDKSLFPITQTQVDEWANLYPAVDVMQQLRSMRGWLDANPTKRKTRSGILRFVNSWLSREQDNGPRSRVHPLAAAQPQATNEEFDGDWGIPTAGN